MLINLTADRIKQIQALEFEPSHPDRATKQEVAELCALALALIQKEQAGWRVPEVWTEEERDRLEVVFQRVYQVRGHHAELADTSRKLLAAAQPDEILDQHFDRGVGQ